MAETIVLQTAKRTVTGKEVRHLRREGIIPGVLYGPGLEPLSLQVPWTDLRSVLLHAGGSRVIELSVDGEKYNALVRSVQRTPIRGDVMHIDFYRVQMDVAIRTEVPVVLTGNADAIEDADGVLVHELMSLTVECLPGDLPSEITVDVSGLTEVGQMILVSDLPELPGVTYHDGPDTVIVSTTYQQRATEEEEEEEEAVEAEEGEEPELIRRQDEEDEDEE